MDENTTFEFKDRDWLYHKYAEKHLSTSEIGRICGCSEGTIKKWLRRLNISVRPRGITKGYLSEEVRQRTGVKRRGSRNPSWKGGRTKGKDGYVYVWVSPEDFFHPMTHKKNRVSEHRLVMAKYLGRCLLPWEVVHHKGTHFPHDSMENKSDNSIENLELLPHNRFHLVDLRAKNYIKTLEKENAELKAKIIDLTGRI